LVHAVGLAHGLCLRVWLALLALLTVRTDPFGRARAPIPVRLGRRRLPAAVHLTDASDVLQLRLVAYFWRNCPEQTCQALHALVGRHFGDADTPLDVSGVVTFPRRASAPRALPLAFRVRLDPAAEAFTLTHAGAAPPCAHEAAALALGSAAIGDALRPLLGRNGCPVLFPKRG
jgi:hypothetical protein